MNDNKEKINLDKSRIISNVLIATITIVLSVVVLGSLAIVAIPVIKDSRYTTSNKETSVSLSRVKEALNKISDKYIEDVDMEKLVNGAISGIASATEDPYTRYMTQEEYENMLTSGTEVYGGIGVHITFDKDTGGIVVLGVMPDSPAEKVGIKSGDIFISIQDVLITKENYTESVDALKGEPGTQVKVIIKRGNETFEKNVTRENVSANNIESEVLDSNIGYIKIWSFDNNVYKQFKTEYDKLKAKNIKGLIIDVRNNPGGLVSDTISILKELLPKCDLLKLVYKDGSEKVYKCDGRNEIKIPLVVLANSRSASASEILSGAIKDSGKGVIIGNKTYGKGIVQEVESLQGNGALSITVAKYYTSSGIEIHKNGIQPDINVDLPSDVANDNLIPRDKDTQLNRAIEYIKNGK